MWACPSVAPHGQGHLRRVIKSKHRIWDHWLSRTTNGRQSTGVLISSALLNNPTRCTWLQKTQGSKKAREREWERDESERSCLLVSPCYTICLFLKAALITYQNTDSFRCVLCVCQHACFAYVCVFFFSLFALNTCQTCHVH